MHVVMLYMFVVYVVYTQKMCARMNVCNIPHTFRIDARFRIVLWHSAPRKTHTHMFKLPGDCVYIKRVARICLKFDKCVCARVNW